MRRVVAAALATLCFLFLSCRGRETPPRPVPEEILGPYVVTGTVATAPLSLYRRGTHRLLIRGGERFFLESTAVDLSQYLGQEVVLKGEVIPNTHATFAPVLVVSSVTPHGGAPPSGELEVAVRGFPLHLRVPAAWAGRSGSGSYTFSSSPDRPAFLTIVAQGGDLPSGGLPMRVGGRPAVRLTGEGGRRHEVHVAYGSGRIVFVFAPGLEEVELREEFYASLTSATFDPGGEPVPLTQTGALGPPCGGSAGVLCPAGSYCAITDPKEGIGRCVKR